MEAEDAVVQVSGGIDSAAAALVAASTYRTVWPLFIDFGAPYADNEFKAAHEFVEKLRAIHDNVKPLASRDVVLTPAVYGQPYIPGRNGVLGLMSVNYAALVGANCVVVGSKTDQFRFTDPYCFPDCTSDFYKQLGALARTMLNNHAMRFEQPLKGWAKIDAVALLQSSGFPASMFWSCYEGGDEPCGRCYHCRERAALLGGHDAA